MSRPISNVLILLAVDGLLIASLTGCHQTAEQEKPTAESPSVAATVPTELDIEDSTPADYRLNLPPHFGRWTGDWDEIRKHNILRMLVVYSKTSFFYDRARPNGLNAAVARELEVYLNKKLKTRAKKFHVAIIPVPPDQLLPDLNEGMGDIISASVFVSPEREQIVTSLSPSSPAPVSLPSQTRMFHRWQALPI
jgi:ABC-type amino acid transport substrate-binding protein